MPFIVGLDPNIYLFSSEYLTEKNLDIAVAELNMKLDLAISENIRYLYNKHLDERSLLGEVKNIFLEIENDPSLVTISNLGGDHLEYIEKKYIYDDSNHLEMYNFDVLILGYINGILQYLYQNYFHTLIISNIEINVAFNNHIFYFKKEFSSVNTCDICFLLKPTTYEEFIQYFSAYHLYFGREKYNILLSNTFINQIRRLTPNELHDVLTSIFRGIYFPNFMLRNGEQKGVYTITTHSDKETRYMQVNLENTTLYRIHCVDIASSHGGLKRICYTKNIDYYFIFYYHNGHCNTLQHEETLDKPKQYKNYQNSVVNKTFLIKVRK